MLGSRAKTASTCNITPTSHYRSSKIVQTESHEFNVLGTVSLRVISKTEKLTFTTDRKEDGKGTIKENLWFARKDCGSGGSIPLVTIA